LALFDDFLSGAHGSRVHPFEEIVMKRFSEAIKAACVVLGFAMAVTPALADQGSIPPWQLPQLTAEWWQWLLSIPSSVNPLTDTKGDYCMVGQRGPIWFLVGSPGASPVSRSCSVPQGTTLFFPVINTATANTPNACGQGPENLTAKEQQAGIKPFIDAAQNLKVTVDHQTIKKTLLRRVLATPFAIALPEDNLFVPGCSTLNPPGQPAGVFSPAVADGYYVSLDLLKPGSHEIHIQAQSDSFTVDVTYNLTIVPVSLK
jgi:hypothetical protein